MPVYNTKAIADTQFTKNRQLQIQMIQAGWKIIDMKQKSHKGTIDSGFEAYHRVIQTPQKAPKSKPKFSKFSPIRKKGKTRGNARPLKISKNGRFHVGANTGAKPPMGVAIATFRPRPLWGWESKVACNKFCINCFNSIHALS